MRKRSDKKQDLREKNKKIFITIIIILSILSLISFGIYMKKDKNQNNYYTENSKLDYEVNLKKNEFYSESVLKKDKQYIASLIDTIKVKLNYDLNMKEKIDYNYAYKIVGEVSVIDSTTNKTIYESQENLIEEENKHNTGNLNINKEVEIKYEDYNNKIVSFVTSYGLRNVTSTLNIRMYVGIDEKEQKLENLSKSVVTMEIPLTSNTIPIDVTYDTLNNVNSLVTKDLKNDKTIWLKIGSFAMILDAIMISCFAVKEKIMRTDEEKYNSQLKKILNSYGSYISQVENEIDMKDYKILKVATFVDLLEIRDTLHCPIIMIENKKQMQSCFMILTNNNILYFFSIGVTQYALPTAEKTTEKMI